MKTTVDLPDDLLIQAKLHAVRYKKTLKELIVSGLRRELVAKESDSGSETVSIRWITADGGLPAGVDGSDRESQTILYDRTE